MTSIRPHLFRRRALALPGTLLLAAALLLLGLPLERPAPARAAPGDLLNETFTGTTLSTPWTFGASGGSAAACLTAGGALGCGAATGGGVTGTLPDPAGNGALRLTNNGGNQAGFALSNTVIPSGNGIAVSFDYYAYGGTGADGITFFLIDGSANPTQAGSFGGSLGYAQRLTPSAQPGIVGGYIGIGIDEFGNFSNASEGRGNGCTTNYGTAGSAGLIATGASPDRVTVRGARNTSDATGLSGYCYLASGSVGSSLDNPAPGVTNRTGAARHTIQLTLSPQNVLTVRVDGTTIVSGLDLDSVAGQPAFPASFKVGFAGSTGGSTNYHEVQNLLVQPLGPDLAIVKSHTGDFTVGQPNTYTLQVTNGTAGGPVLATDGITVTDTLPPQLSYVSAAGTNWSCGASGQVVTCVYTAFPVGTGVSLPPITLTVLPIDFSQTVINTATVTTPRELNPADNTDDDQTNLVSQADLAVVKLRTANAAPGQAITYNISVVNNGPSPVTGATVQDNVPAAIGGVTWTCAPVARCGAPSGSGNAISIALNLPVGQAATITVNGTLSASAAGVLANTATVSTPAGTTDPNPNNNTSTDSYNIDATAVTLTSFQARRAGGQVQLTWSTSAEVATQGFRLYRSSTGLRADAQLLTAQLIPAAGQGGAGARYSWTDSTAQAGVPYSYWLAEVALSETTTEYGPAQALAARLFIPFVAR